MIIPNRTHTILDYIKQTLDDITALIHDVNRYSRKTIWGSLSSHIVEIQPTRQGARGRMG